MNRREALATLMALPAVSRIASVPSDSDDVIVIEAERELSQEEMEHIHEKVQSVWPNRRIVITDAGLRLKLAPAK